MKSSSPCSGSAWEPPGPWAPSQCRNESSPCSLPPQDGPTRPSAALTKCHIPLVTWKWPFACTPLPCSSALLLGETALGGLHLHIPPGKWVPAVQGRLWNATLALGVPSLSEHRRGCCWLCIPHIPSIFTMSYEFTHNRCRNPRMGKISPSWAL